MQFNIQSLPNEQSILSNEDGQILWIFPNTHDGQRACRQLYNTLLNEAAEEALKYYDDGLQDLSCSSCAI
jgi:hypothetical protein